MKPFLIILSLVFFTTISNGQKAIVAIKDSACIGWKVIINGNTSVCRPGTIQFTASEQGGTWSSSNISAVGTINQNGLFSTGSRAGTTKITYIVSNANGCKDTAIQWITILDKPNAGIISGDNKICMGGTIQFTTTGTGGTWSSSNISAVGSIDQNGLFTTGTNAGTTKIMYIVTNANGCSDTAFKWITILNKPNAGIISGDTTVCMGRSIRFTSSRSGGTWSSSNISAVGTISQSGIFTTGTNAGTTKIMYIVSNANGCSDTAFKWITILNSPFAGTITGNNSICRGGNIQFTTTGTGGTWSSSNISAVGSINQNGLFTTGTNAGTTKIMYIVTNANGCSDTAFKWITILNKPNAGIISGDTTVCMGRSIRFTSSRSGGTWSSSNISAVGTISQNGIFTTGTTAGTTKIMYIVSNANGCSDTAFKWITILNSPFAGTITGNTSICRGGTIQFTTTGTGGTWSSSNISAVGTIDQNGLFTTGTNAGTTKIMYIVTNANGCSDTAYKWITILNKPNAGTIVGDTVVCLGATIQFTTSGTGGTWSSSNISVVGTINQNGIFTTGTNAGTTKIMYIVANKNGCRDTAFKWITIRNCVVNQKQNTNTSLVQELVDKTKSDFSIFPNPSKSIFSLRSNNSKPGIINVIDLSGRVIQSSAYTPNQIFTFGELYSSGIYWVEVIQNNKVTRIQTIKAR